MHSVTHSFTHTHTLTQESQGCKIRGESVLGRKLPHWCARLHMFQPSLISPVCVCACIYVSMCVSVCAHVSTPSLSFTATKKTQRTYCAQGRKITPFSEKERNEQLSLSFRSSLPTSLLPSLSLSHTLFLLPSHSHSS